MKLVIDTDIGTDPDDAFALAYAIKHPNADVKAITIVHGDTNIRAKIVRKLEKMLQVNIPITTGETCSEKMIKKYWCGFEPRALTEEELQEPFYNNKYPEYNEDTKLVCLGPLTNIALQLEKNPSIKKVRDIYVMGSSPDSHNFVVDPKATKQVFSQPWNIWQVTKKDSLKIYFTLKELANFKENDLGSFLYDSVKRWFDYTGRAKAPMYDVLVASAALEEDLVKFKQQNGKFVSYDVDLKLKDKIIKVIRSD